MLSKKNNKKGFTLMEMLIVVAIIAVLIAIAIPTFTASLNKARVATDEANIRSGYASVMAEVLANEEKYPQTNGNESYEFTLNTDGSVKTPTVTTGTAYATKGNATKVVDNNGTIDIAGQPVTPWTANEGVSYTYKPADNTVTITVGAATENP